MRFDRETQAALVLVAGFAAATATIPVYLAGYVLLAPVPAIVGVLLIVHGLRTLDGAGSGQTPSSTHR